MSEPKFTPRPWKACPRTANIHATVRTERGGTIAVVHSGTAHAHLIAAAPALYEALKAVETSTTTRLLHAVRKQVRAALLAADGALGASTPGADGEAGSTGRSPDPIPTEGRKPNQ